MANDRVVKKICEWELIRTGMAGRPKIRGQNDIKQYFRITIINN